GEPLRDLSLWWRGLLACLQGARASVLAGCAQLDTCSFREALHAEVAEESVRDPQLLARVDVSTSAPQPFAVHQMSAGEVEAQCRGTQTIDGGAVSTLGGVAVAQQCARSRGDCLAPRCVTCRRRRLGPV